MVNSILANHFPTSQSACMKSTIHLSVWHILKQFILTVPLSITRPVSIHKKYYSPECVAYSKTIYSPSASLLSLGQSACMKSTIHLSVWHSLKQFILTVPISITRPISMHKKHYSPECVAYSKTIYSYSAYLYN